tara:strand:+ start:929 stop:1198 length:270 start_codon:yes stop_codon:yes gene_type:complete
MRPICVPCGRFFKPAKNGFNFTEGMPPTGNAPPDEWVPYKIWSGDRYECSTCGANIIVGVGASPISEHYHEDFEHNRRILEADQFQVNG